MLPPSRDSTPAAVPPYEPCTLTSPLVCLQYQLNERLVAGSTTWRPLLRPLSRASMGRPGPGSAATKADQPLQATFMHPAAMQATSMATGLIYDPLTEAVPLRPAPSQKESVPAYPPDNHATQPCHTQLAAGHQQKSAQQERVPARQAPRWLAAGPAGDSWATE